MKSLALIFILPFREVLAIAASSQLSSLLDGTQALGNQRDCKENWTSLKDAQRDHKLRGTVSNIPADNTLDLSNIEEEKNLHDLFVSKEHQFAFCMIQKNGCTAWAHVLEKIYVEDTELYHKPPRYGVGKHSQEKLGFDGVRQLFHNGDTTRVVFVRDPIARFASAFLGKCVSGLDLGNCFTNSLEEAQRATMNDAVEWAKEQGDLRNTANSHWKAQAMHCELRKYLSAYHIIGVVNKDTYGSDAACVLSRAGLAKYNVIGSKVNDKDLDPGQTPEDPIFSENGPAINQKNLTSTDWDEARVLKRLFTKSAAEGLFDILRPDYDLFGFAKPDWIVDATGEWFQTRPAVSLNDQSGFLSPSAEQEDEPDDLVELAVRVGLIP